MRYFAVLFLLCEVVVGQAGSSPTPVSKASAQTCDTSAFKPIPCNRPYWEDQSICEIDLEDLQQMENQTQHPAIQVNKGDTVTWQWRETAHKFMFAPFKQVDCKTGQLKPDGAAKRPFSNKFDDDDLQEDKWSTVSSNADECSCFKHMITIPDGQPIDPHVIIGPGTGLKERHLRKRDREEDEEQKESQGHRDGTIDPFTCLKDKTCQDCPEPKSESLCGISTAWLRSDDKKKDHLPVLLHWGQQVIWYTPVSHATIQVLDFSEVSCSNEERVLRKSVEIVRRETKDPAPSQSGFMFGKIGGCYKHHIKGSGGEEPGVDPHVIIGPGIQ